MALLTKLDLSQQSKIPLNQIAELDGSISLGQKFFITGVELILENGFSDYVLAFDPLTNSFKPTPAAYTALSGNRVISGMGITTNPTGNYLSYAVSNGIYTINGNYYNFTGDSFTISAGDPTYDRFDVVYVTGGTEYNQIVVLEGIPAITPIIQTPPTDSVVLNILEVKAGATTAGTVNISSLYTLNANQIYYSRGSYSILSDFLDANYINPKIESFTNNINVLQFGQTGSSITFEWSVNKTGKIFNLSPTGGTYDNSTFNFTLNGQFITGNTSNSSTTFTLVFDDGVSTTNKTTNVVFYNKFYFGTSSLTGLTSTNIQNLEYKEFINSSKFNQTNISGGSKYIYFAIPTRFSKPTFLVNGILFNDFVESVVSFTNEYGFTEDYYLFRTTNLVHSDNFVFETI